MGTGSPDPPMSALAFVAVGKVGTQRGSEVTKMEDADRKSVDLLVSGFKSFGKHEKWK